MFTKKNATLSSPLIVIPLLLLLTVSVVLMSAQTADAAATPGGVRVTTLANITGRAIVVGDIHGCLEPLKELLRKANFSNSATRANPDLLASEGKPTSSPDGVSTSEDVCVFVGDLVNKGPASYEVVRFLRDIHAHGTLGNHDVKLLRLYERLREAAAVPGTDPLATLTEKERNSTLLPLAQHCPEDVYQYLSALPHVLRLPQFRVIVVHAGVDPSLPLEAQDPEAVTRMRNLLPVKKLGQEAGKKKNKKKSEGADDKANSAAPEPPLSISERYATLERNKQGKSWAKLYTKKAIKFLQKNPARAVETTAAVFSATPPSAAAAEHEESDSSSDGGSHGAIGGSTNPVKGYLDAVYANQTILFGHDAKRRLQVNKFAIGLDTGCCYGGALTALMLPSRQGISVAGWNPDSKV